MPGGLARGDQERLDLRRHAVQDLAPRDREEDLPRGAPGEGARGNCPRESGPAPCAPGVPAGKRRDLRAASGRHAAVHPRPRGRARGDPARTGGGARRLRFMSERVVGLLDSLRHQLTALVKENGRGIPGVLEAIDRAAYFLERSRDALADTRAFGFVPRAAGVATGASRRSRLRRSRGFVSSVACSQRATPTAQGAGRGSRSAGWTMSGGGRVRARAQSARRHPRAAYRPLMLRPYLTTGLKGLDCRLRAG